MAKRKTAVKSSRAPFEIAGTRIQAGRFEYVEIPIARLPIGTWLHLPIAVIHGTRPGPTIWLSGAVHGDELNGIAIVRELTIRFNPQTMAGTVLAVPVVNVFGLIGDSRYLPDRRDLNRSFPGSQRGSMAGQLAHLFLENVVKRCELGIDFHTGSQGRTNWPQLRLSAGDPKLTELAKIFAPPAMLYTDMLPGSLRKAAARFGIRCLLYEAGEDTRFSRAAIRIGVEGSLRVMQALGMIDDGVPPATLETFVSHRSSWVRATRGGMCKLSISLGDHVEAGDRVAVIFDTLGRHDRAVRARTAGVVIGHLNHAVVNRGEAVAHIAEPDSESAKASEADSQEDTPSSPGGPTSD